MRHPSVVSFYAGREGVGTTVAAVNVARFLCDNGRRVALLDWDTNGCGAFDANGGLGPNTRPEGKGPKTRGRKSQVAGLAEYVDFFLGSGQKEVPSLTGGYVYECEIEATSSSSQPAKLLVMPPGKAGSPSIERLHLQDWKKFYAQPTSAALFEVLIWQLGIQYGIDTVVIDGAAGASPLAWIATHHVADVIVLLTSLDQRERSIVDRLTNKLKRLKGKPSLLGVLSMTPSLPPHYPLIEEHFMWLRERQRCGASHKLDPVGLPYRSFLGLGAGVIVRDDPWSTLAPYRSLAESIEKLIPLNVDEPETADDV